MINNDTHRKPLIIMRTVTILLACVGVSGCSSIEGEMKRNASTFIHGYAAPEFDGVRQAFIENFEKIG